MLVLCWKGIERCTIGQNIRFLSRPLIVGDGWLSDCAVGFLAVDVVGIFAGDTAYTEVPLGSIECVGNRLDATKFLVRLQFIYQRVRLSRLVHDKRVNAIVGWVMVVLTTLGGAESFLSDIACCICKISSPDGAGSPRYR
jgi:hypothetical protein